jgi:hypothetical protein
MLRQIYIECFETMCRLPARAGVPSFALIPRVIFSNCGLGGLRKIRMSSSTIHEPLWQVGGKYIFRVLGRCRRSYLNSAQSDGESSFCSATLSRWHYSDHPM